MLTQESDLHKNSLLHGCNQKQKNIILLFGIFLLNFIVYGVDCFQHALCGDEIKELMEVVPDIYIAQRRWGVALWRECFGYGYLPFLSVVIFCAANSLTALIHTKLFNLSSDTGRLVYSAAYCLCPVLHHILTFSQLTDAFSISMLSGSLAVLFVTASKSYRQYTLSIIFAIFSLSIYQINLFYIPSLWLAWYASTVFQSQSRSFIRESIRFCSAFIISIAIYATVATILRRSGAAAPDIIQMIDQYQGNLAGEWKSILECGSLLFILKVFLHYFIESLPHAAGITPLMGGSSTYTHIYLITVSCCCGWVLIHSWFKFPCKKAILLNLLVLGIFYIPFSAYVLSTGRMNEFRMYLACCISSAFIITLASSFTSSNKAISRIIPILLCFFCIKAAYTHTMQQRNRAWNFERTKLQFIEIKHHCKDIAKQNGLKEYNVYLAGDWWPIKSISLYNALEVAEAPFLTGIVQPFAVKHYAAYFGCGNIDRMEAADTPEEVKHILRTKPVWPDPDSVFIYNGDIIIKAYENPPPIN